MLKPRRTAANRAKCKTHDVRRTLEADGANVYCYCKDCKRGWFEWDNSEVAIATLEGELDQTVALLNDNIAWRSLAESNASCGSREINKLRTKLAKANRSLKKLAAIRNILASK